MFLSFSCSSSVNPADNKYNEIEPYLIIIEYIINIADTEAVTFH